MSDRALRVSVALLSTAGAAVGAYLTYARFTGTQIACATGGCETVQSSRYAEIAGMPVAVLGLAAYLLVLATAFSTADLSVAGGAAVALAGVLFSVYLLYVQLELVGALCQWCLVSDAILTLLAIATVLRVVVGREVVAGPG